MNRETVPCVYFYVAINLQASIPPLHHLANLFQKTKLRIK